METTILPDGTKVPKDILHLSSLPGMKAPWFEGKCFLDDKFHHISLEDYEGYWLVLFFYPEDYDYMSPTDLLGLNDQHETLRKKNCKIIGISTSSSIVHKQFASVSPKNGGVQGIRFPLLEDFKGQISKSFSVLSHNEGFHDTYEHPSEVHICHSFRAYFIINPKGIIEARVVYDLPIGLGVKELVRQLVVLQKGADSGKLIGCCGEVLGSEDKHEMDIDIEVEIEPEFEFFSPWYNENILYDMGLANFESPINIQTLYVVEDPDLSQLGIDFSTQLKPAKLRNTGYGWQVNFSPYVDTMVIYGGPLESFAYRLGYLKAHWGSSEHSVNGSKYDGELHFVFHNKKYISLTEAEKHLDGIAIIAVFLEEVETLSSFGSLEAPPLWYCIKEHIDNNYDSIKNAGDMIPINMCDPAKLLPKYSRDYWTYKGSTTEKTMIENVTWIIFKERLKIEDGILKSMMKLRFPDGTKVMANYKPVQDLNSRVIFQPNREFIN